MQIQVMSFNIRYDAASDVNRNGDNRWEVRRPRVAAAIRGANADVVGLQEVLHHQREWLQEALPEYATLGVGRDDGETRGEYALLLYRREQLEVGDSGTFWFSPTPETVGSRGWGATLARVCTWARLVERETGQAFYIYNLHLDHQSAPAREQSVKLLAERIRQRGNPAPAVVTGDFNAAEVQPPMAFLRSADSPVPVDTYRALNPDAPGSGTYHEFDGVPQDRIDYILATPEWEVLEATILHEQIDGGYPSDHFPITALLRGAG
jgi:endonuclease/exonuclease/phosphatase family metal-dependent hydrolase